MSWILIVLLFNLAGLGLMHVAALKRELKVAPELRRLRSAIHEALHILNTCPLATALSLRESGCDQGGAPDWVSQVLDIKRILYATEGKDRWGRKKEAKARP